MPPRYIALIVAAVVVFGAGLYLFREVRTAPASASTPPPAPATAAPEQPAPAVATQAPSFKPKMGIPTNAPPSTSSGGSPAIAAAANRTFSVQPPPEPGSPEELAANPNLDLAMSEANKAYDKQDYEAAKVVAQRVLARSPNNVRMLRILVSTACIDNDQPTAQKYYLMLPPPPDQNRAQMKLRCARDFQIELKDP